MAKTEQGELLINHIKHDVCLLAVLIYEKCTLHKVLSGSGRFLLFTKALHKISKRWTMPVRDWKSALHLFAMLYGEPGATMIHAVYIKYGAPL